jgi:enoyl-CoA hydratase/carnithine racemase
VSVLSGPDVRYDVCDSVAIATFDRPDVLNAIRASTVEELGAILEEVRGDERIRCLLLTGAGRAFSSGQDLKEMAGFFVDGVAPAAIEERCEALQRLTTSLVELPLPTIAVLNGVAVGLGAELAVACDLRLAAASAHIGFTEVQRGMFQTNGVTYLLPLLVGLGVAGELMLTGELVDAAEAHRIGLVNRVVPDDDLLDVAMDLARSVARNAPLTMRLLKEALRRGSEGTLDSAMRFEVESVLRLLASDDAREGTSAFLEGREAEYKGS